MMCFKIVRGKETMDRHVVRTIAWTLKREECVGGDGRAVKLVGERFIGKFRSQLQYNKSNYEDVCERKRREENGGIQYVDVAMCRSGRHQHMLRTRGSDGDGSGITKKRRAREKRRMAPLSEFRLFKDGKQTGPTGSSQSHEERGMDSDSGESGRREEESNEGQEEGTVGTRNIEWVSSVSLFRSVTDALIYCSMVGPIRFLCCSEGSRRNQKYVCVSTVRMCRRNSNGD